MARRRLKTAGDIRRYLANVINDVHDGKMDLNKSGKIGFLCNVLLKSLEICDVDERIRRIEEQQNDLLGHGGK